MGRYILSRLILLVPILLDEGRFGEALNLLERYPDETTVFPGHMGVTTLGRERASNPFLAELV